MDECLPKRGPISSFPPWVNRAFFAFSGAYDAHFCNVLQWHQSLFSISPSVWPGLWPAVKWTWHWRHVSVSHLVMIEAKRKVWNGLVDMVSWEANRLTANISSISGSSVTFGYWKSHTSCNNSPFLIWNNNCTHEHWTVRVRIYSTKFLYDKN